MSAQAEARVTVTPVGPTGPGLRAYRLDVKSQVPDEPDGSDEVDVVLVHGLTGHALKTWGIQADGEGTVGDSWAARLAVDLRGCARLWTVGYPAPLFADGSTPETLDSTGSQALRDLCTLGFGERKLIFVAHSLGGILVKTMLCQAMNTEGRPERRLLANTHAVVFAGTPHSGSNLTRWRRVIPWIAKAVAMGAGAWFAAAVGGAYLVALTIGVFAFDIQITVANLISMIAVPLAALLITSLLAPSRQLLALDPDNPALFDLTTSFRRVVRMFPFSTAAFYERRHLWWFFMAVPRSSADPGLTDCRPDGIDANHIAMCKDPHAGRLVREIELQVAQARRGKDRAVFEDRLGLDQELHRKIAPLMTGTPPRFVKRFMDVTGDRAGAENALRRHLRQLIAKGQMDVNPLTLDLARTSEFDIDVFVWQVWQEQSVMAVRRTLRACASEVVSTWPALFQENERPTLIPFYRSLRTIEHIYRGDLSEFGVRTSDCAELAELVRRAKQELDLWCPRIHGVINGRKWALDGDAGTRHLLLRMQCTLEAIIATCEFFEREARERHEDAARHAAELDSLSRRFEQALSHLKRELDGPTGVAPTHPMPA